MSKFVLIINRDMENDKDLPIPSPYFFDEDYDTSGLVTVEDVIEMARVSGTNIYIYRRNWSMVVKDLLGNITGWYKK